MTPQDYARMRANFDAALTLEPSARMRYLDIHVPPDDPIRAELLAMLEANVDSRFLASPLGVSPKASRPALEQIGPYRVVRELGRGGMGVVYLATRNDEVFRKTVAIKVIGLAGDGERLSERFKEERQILAHLDHPSIARILDGGTTKDGRPYYVMEYVDGSTLDDYCRRTDAGIIERIRLVLQVCDALDYLHGQDVIHRDIKPSNILVTAEGRVKLLDFGIATVTVRNAAPSAARPTLMMTPGYASPEQVLGDRVDQSADIYSLAVVLYELLSGRLPFAGADGRPNLTSQLSEVSPLPPSQAVQANAVGTPGISRSLGIDLDHVLVTALQREPLRRYRSIRSFADDLHRYLDNRPITARADNTAYAFRLLVLRNRLGFALGGLLVVFACAGAWSFVGSRMDRVRLEAQAGEIERLVHLLNVRVEHWREGDATVPVDERVADVRTAGQVMASGSLAELSDRSSDVARLRRLMADLRRFLDRAEELSPNEAPVRKEISLVYRRVGDYESNQSRPRVLDRRQATDSYQRAAAIAASVRAAEPEWAGQQLSELSGRLGALGASMPTESAVITAPVATPASPAQPPTVSRSEPAAVSMDAPHARTQDVVIKPPAAGGDPQVVADLNDRLRATQAMAARLKVSVQEMQVRLTKQGQTLRSDLASSLEHANSTVVDAQVAMGEGQWSVAEDMLQRASYELRRLSQSLGQ